MTELKAAFPPPDHDHRKCLAALMTRVDHLCAERHIRLTPQRRQVLEIVAGSHTAVGAYEILARIGSEGRSLAPISVYRALDFLLENGLVHRVESLNAYVACSKVGDAHHAQFLVCRDCRSVVEMNSPSIDAAIADGAEVAAFAVTAPVVEIGGLCPACRGKTRAADAR